MSSFTVDPSALVGLAHDLDRSARDLQRLRGRLDGLGCSGCQAAELDDALGEFGRHWAWAIGRLHERVGTVGAGLRASAAVYADTDAAIAAACE